MGVKVTPIGRRGNKTSAPTAPPVSAAFRGSILFCVVRWKGKPCRRVAKQGIHVDDLPTDAVILLIGQGLCPEYRLSDDIPALFKQCIKEVPGKRLMLPRVAETRRTPDCQRPS